MFAFILFPLRDYLALDQLKDHLSVILPAGAKSLIAMMAYWFHTLFYLAAELWSILILSLLFWGFLNETTTMEEAKNFYPLCMFTGNLAGIVSGQFSHFFCHRLAGYFTWETTLQLLIAAVSVCALLILWINRILAKSAPVLAFREKKKGSFSFLEQCRAIFSNGKLLCIAALVIGFGLTTNLIEVLWKDNIKALHPEPQAYNAYNAYVNQLTSLIGMLAVVMALCSKWLFKKLAWTQTALATPVILFMTSSLFFIALLVPQENLQHIADSFGLSCTHLIVTLGSIYYVCSMTAKYTLFDTTKEMAFLSIDLEERTNAKSVIDSIGSRLGKSGAASFYQFLLIVFGTVSSSIPLIRHLA
jgi:AAA family ATP:ADP antiporter